MVELACAAAAFFVAMVNFAIADAVDLVELTCAAAAFFVAMVDFAPTDSIDIFELACAAANFVAAIVELFFATAAFAWSEEPLVRTIFSLSAISYPLFSVSKYARV